MTPSDPPSRPSYSPSAHGRIKQNVVKSFFFCASFIPVCNDTHLIPFRSHLYFSLTDFFFRNPILSNDFNIYNISENSRCEIHSGLNINLPKQENASNLPLLEHEQW